jgi:hypothetical protein
MSLAPLLDAAPVPLAVWKARRHQVRDRRRIMILLFSGALVIAGLFCCCRAGSCIAWCSIRAQNRACRTGSRNAISRPRMKLPPTA